MPPGDLTGPGVGGCRAGGLPALGLAGGRRAAAPWTPAALPGVAATLLPALMRGTGRLWQERDGSRVTPAVADGDPVGEAVCPYTGVSWTAPTDSARPLLWDELLDGAYWSLSFDGIDDVLSCSGYTPARPHTVALAVADVASLGDGTAFDAGPGNVARLRLADSGYWQPYSGAFLTDNMTAYPAAWVGVVGFGSGSGTFARLAGSDVAIVAQATGDPTGGLTVAAFGNGTQTFTPLRAAGLVAASGLVAGGDRAALESYLSALIAP